MKRLTRRSFLKQSAFAVGAAVTVAPHAKVPARTTTSAWPWWDSAVKVGCIFGSYRNWPGCVW